MLAEGQGVLLTQANRICDSLGCVRHCLTLRSKKRSMLSWGGGGMQRVLGSLQAVTNLWVSLKSTVAAGSQTRSPVGDVWCDCCPHVD